MRSRQDPTIQIVLGISLFVFVLCSYLAWQAYNTQKELREQTLPDRKKALQRQKENYRAKLDRLTKASAAIGWKYMYLDLVPADDHERDYLKDGLYRFETYPDVEELKKQGQLAEKAKEFLTEAGYSESYIEKVTTDQFQTEQLLNAYYKALGSQQQSTLTNLQAMAEHLNQARTVLETVAGDEVDLGSVGRKEDWKIESPDQANTDAPNYLASGPEGVTIAALLKKMNDVLSTLRSKKENLRNEIKSTRQNYYTFTKMYGDQQKISNLISEKNQQISSLESDIESLREDVSSNREQMVENLDEEGEKVWNQQKKKNDLLDQQTRALEARKDRITSLKKRLKRLREQHRKSVEREARKDRVDGEILTVNQDARIGFVNIGKSDGLFRGTTFEVFNTAKGGRLIEKGTIEITNRFDEYSRFKIVRQPDRLNRPISSGDLIRSETFDPEDVKVFVFAGHMKGNYDRSTLRELIEENGHRVAPGVSSQTDFLIVGRGYRNDRDYEKARDLGIDTISQKQLQRMFDLD